MIFSRNNLDKAGSPYLQQHKDNPVWWQEWRPDVLAYAKAEGKPLFVSVGYSTCHWCHVMAAEAFQDKEVAGYLNQNFISIKVDREQRPDIDSYLIAFITDLGGTGGWPLNGFLSPDLRPIFALTYAPPKTVYGRTGLLEILQKVKEYYDRERENLKTFDPSAFEFAEIQEEELTQTLWNVFDQEEGGFGLGMKFPPHCTLLFLLYAYPSYAMGKMRVIIERTLDVMLMRGLHDHLQGGFFRYCVDRSWTIPHFEKMLYDQAMLLWIYSLAYATFGKKSYLIAVEKILKCLEETFEDNGVYYSGHDADTDHKEGATYLWDEARIREILTSEEYREFTAVYEISPQGNFEGKNHLVRKTGVFLDEIEKKLLAARQKIPQPFVDKKIITSWNCLLGIGLVHAYRFTKRPETLDKARALLKSLLEKHWKDGKLAHSSCGGEVQGGEFLQDYAALLLFITYLYEETGQLEEEMRAFYDQVRSFEQGERWWESLNEDFLPVHASDSDHPTPSSISLSQLALLRTDILLGKDYALRKYHGALYSDFYNIATLLANGHFHIMETPQLSPREWKAVNILQRPGKKYRDCYHGVCREIEPVSHIK